MKYDKRGVSADKHEVHNAIKNLDKGLFPNAFCKVLPDYLNNDDQYGLIMHADTAGTKTSLAYLYWKETGDLSVWKGIVQDAIIMNIDDMACVGIVDNLVLSSTIGRNKNLITADVISELINQTLFFLKKMSSLGINIHLAGGETADVGDIVRTIDVGVTVTARIRKDHVIVIDPHPGDVIVGLSSFGRSFYEDEYNSGIGSNGLTFARHEVLSKVYAENYPESFDPNLDDSFVYTGKNILTTPSPIDGITTGKLLLSPTRTYMPVIKEILQNINKEDIHGIIHCTGGGQTKILHFINDLQIIKNNMFEIPPVFKMIQKQGNCDWAEMFKVFNMGHRLEIYCPESVARLVIDSSEKFNIKAQIIGYVEKSESKTVEIHHSGKVYTFN